MANAFQCDLCKEYSNGSGTKVMYGRIVPTAIGTDKVIDKSKELCDECKDGLDEIVADYLETSSD